MNDLILYVKKNCPLCDEITALIELFKSDYEMKFEEVDIETDEKLLERYMLEVPVLYVNGEELDYRSIDYLSIEKRLH
ncbi:glutaredoxin family protein [Halobacillus litoralis]|uniref:glutaredoxin family protein n=1 Tax=Halobacillus litoralis TaxID=45668 RepID=UPI001CD79AC0|nr:glutaredoxin family protein [Halobacillus litoralis]MCA0971656.1 glutaredoxin family protein [Halobacillus litoralis]